MADKRKLTDEEIETRREKRKRAGNFDKGKKGDVPKEEPDFKDSGPTGATNDLIVDADGMRDAEDETS